MPAASGTKKTFIATIGTIEKQVTVTPTDDGRWLVVIDGVERILEARRGEGGAWTLVADGRVRNVDVEVGKQGDLLVEVAGVAASLKLVDPRTKKLEEAKAAARSSRPHLGPEELLSPMPGKLVKLLVKAGDAVKAGQGVAVIEAMKMENELKATRDGVVKAIHVAEGSAVEGQQPVLTIE